MTRREYIQSTIVSLGYVASVGTIANLLLSCQQQADLSWKPVFLSNNQANLLAEITETILPKTKTPGAKDLGVPQFIDQLITKVMTKAEQKEFTDGLEDLDQQCKSANGKTFVECDTATRTSFLKALDASAGTFSPSVWGIQLIENPKPVKFFRKLKSLTLMSYYTSEKVGKEILVYNPVPGKYDACIPYSGQHTSSE